MKSGSFNLKIGDLCWVETFRGNQLGEVIMANTRAHTTMISENMPCVLGPADSKDLQQDEQETDREKIAFDTCLKLITTHKLPMKLVKTSFVNGGKKVIFFFTAEGRVDFRGLLKDLAKEFKIRIELRQIGVRDEAKILGGTGTCGRTLCCSTWIEEFNPVSIKMAKQQKLSLDPQKISGICGRLKCCLAYEAEGKWGCCKDGSSDQGKRKKKNGCPKIQQFPRPYDPPL